MDIKDFFDKQFEKAKPEQARQAEWEAGFDAEWEAEQAAKATSKTRHRQLAEQLHTLLKPIINQFVESANRFARRGKVKLTRTSFTDASGTILHS